MDLLRAQGLDLNERDADGQTPLGQAAQCGHAILLEALLTLEEAAQAIDGVNAAGDTLMMLAAVQRLLQAGADLQAINADGFNAMWLAVDQDHAEVVGALLGAWLVQTLTTPANGGPTQGNDAQDGGEDAYDGAGETAGHSVCQYAEGAQHAYAVSSSSENGDPQAAPSQSARLALDCADHADMFSPAIVGVHSTLPQSL